MRLSGAEMFDLPPLPYDKNALEPVISARTIELHHGKHHAGYVAKLNAALRGSALTEAPLEEIVRLAAEKQDAAIFNNAGQAWNHAFYWQSMRPSEAGAAPAGALATALSEAFEGAGAFPEAFRKAGETHFGSGWLWLAAGEDGSVRLLTTHDADTPIREPGCFPLLTCDLWEHAYYLDHQNERGEYLKAWLARLANWRFAESQFAAALKGEGGWRHPPPSS
ncbi:MAG: superoxide dismutase [Hyphomonadaceae bacterium]